jgi:hypothetical protein
MTLFENLRMGTEGQIAAGDRVASRRFLTGTYRRRPRA